jgi:hypothetical protein
VQPCPKSSVVELRWYLGSRLLPLGKKLLFCGLGRRPRVRNSSPRIAHAAGT